jgi:hypothetical protein
MKKHRYRTEPVAMLFPRNKIIITKIFFKSQIKTLSKFHLF